MDKERIGKAWNVFAIGTRGLLSLGVTSVLASVSLATAASAADQLPRESRVPGGIALVTVAPAYEAKPAVTRDGANVWTVKRGASWVAVVGIPLATVPGEHSISVNRNGEPQSVAFTVKEKRYPVQHVTLKDNAMVEPPPELIARIETESAHLKTVRSKWREDDAVNASFALPAVGRLSGRFGGSRVLNGKPRAPHAGLDLAIGTGTPVLAPGDGIVLDTGDYYFCGKTMFIDHGNGLLSLFCHLSECTATVGDTVRKGQAVARSGATGRASGPHLHWSVYLNAVSVEPELFVNIARKQ
ncbi:MAG: peptidoglycan DD-metalloendopeptidase family protein [Casimicrobium sp.]